MSLREAGDGEESQRKTSDTASTVQILIIIYFSQRRGPQGIDMRQQDRSAFPKIVRPRKSLPSRFSVAVRKKRVEKKQLKFHGQISWIDTFRKQREREREGGGSKFEIVDSDS